MDHEDAESIIGTERMQSEMELEIHNLERVAYGAILQAFKAQSDAITWEREGLITALRKELKVSNEEHRELLKGVKSDDRINRIKEWREGGKPTDCVFVVDPTTLIGRSVMRRRREDNKFYKAMITEYNPVNGHHALVYNINTPKSIEEWADINQIPRKDIRWVGDAPATSQLGRARRGRPSSTNQSIDLDEIKIYNTNSLIKKVEKVLEESDPDQSEVERAKKLLKEQEEKLVQVIAMLKGNDGEGPSGHGPSSGS